MSIPSTPKPWIGVGTRTRELLRAPPRVCSLRLAVMAGCRLVPLDHPHELRVGSDIALDFEQELRRVRGDAALGLASWLLERAGVLPQLDLEAHNEALVHVALELVLPMDEFERAWRAQAGELEEIDQYYRQHVPSEWLIQLAERMEAAGAPV